MQPANQQNGQKLISNMQSEPQRFTLNQLIRLLSFFNAKGKSKDEFFQDDIYIKNWLSLAFPASEAVEIEQDKDGHIEITATDFGLYSTMGSLPTFYTEELLEEAGNDESVSRSFLDIINNQLYHLRYKADYHHNLERRTIEQSDFAAKHIQTSLMGEALIAEYAKETPIALFIELMIDTSRSVGGLELFLTYTLERDDIRIEQCIDHTIDIPKNQLCTIGQKNSTLGKNCVIGKQARDSAGKFRVHLDKIEEEDIEYFLPDQKSYKKLYQSIRRYLPNPLEYDLTLHPSDKESIPRELGKNTMIGFYLGDSTYREPVTIYWKW